MNQSQNKQTTLQYRYPGTRPFTADDRNLFFGRDDDVERLSQFINLESSIVLYGKSGLGKTSLLNAGVVPLLCEQENYEAIDVRFGSYLPENDINPTEILRQKISERISFGNFLWKKVLKLPELKDISSAPEKGKSTIPDDLWYYFKSLQIQHREKEAFLIVFDQFEELFTYPDKSITLFEKEISDLLNVRAPQYIRNTVKKELKDDSNFISYEEMQLLFKPLNMKVIISIRSDRMSFLNRLKDYLPDILKKTYELKPLDIKQAKDAILEPAKKEGCFASPIFDYEQSALDNILRYLSKDGRQRIESFQLQLLCQYAEKLVINSQMQKTPFLKINNQKPLLTKSDFGDFDTIFKRHYDSLIDEIGDDKDRKAAQELIEDHLIVEGNRVSLPEIVITSRHNISLSVLKQLVSSRLLRSEPNTTGGFSYEISHDTLVAPILEARKLSVEIKEKERAEKERREELLIMQERQKRQRTIIIIVAAAAIISIGVAVWGFIQKNKAEKLASNSIEVLKTMMPKGTHNVYEYFRDKGIAGYKEGDYVNARTNLKSANLAPDVPVTTDLELWLSKINTCLRLGQKANEELSERNFAEAQEICEQIIAFNKDANVDKCRLSLCKLFTEQMITVQSGSFEMGSEEGKEDEKPVHPVTLDDFYISKYEITNAQYAHFLNEYGSSRVRNGAYAEKQMVFEDGEGVKFYGNVWLPQPGYENHPIVGVTWYGAYEFCRFYSGSLPTEAQWEYAARSGGKEEVWAGTSNEKILKEYAWFLDAESDIRSTQPTGMKKPNGLGIYDMSGNVLEWCNDRYGKYPTDEQKNRQGADSDTFRVIRGGGWYSSASNCRIPVRNYEIPDFRGIRLGFRFARTVNF